MYRIVYGKFRIDNEFKPIGKYIIEHVDGDTIEEVNKAFAEKRLHNDCVMYTPLNFMDVMEIE